MQQYTKKGHVPWSSGIHLRDARISQYLQINQYDTWHQKLKNENHTIISIDEEEAIHKI